ncbi:response regulator [Leptolyngbyaceae cyanobacterium UHCC 1019]
MKILLVEDDQPTCEVIADALMAHHYRVDRAADGAIGLELAEQFEYDLILLDVVLPKLDGMSLCKQLRSKGCESPILLLTAKDSTTDRVMGLDAGADDYVVKPFDTSELLARVRALLRRGKSVSAGIITWENLRFDPVNGEVIGGETLLRLTPKEYCLLELFLLNPKRIFSRQAILDRLWDFAESPGEETVSTHIKCLRQKLKAAGVANLVETVHGLGYRLKPPVQEAEEMPVDSPVETPKREADRRKVTANLARVWEKSKDQFAAQVGVLKQAAIALATDALTSELQQQAKHEAHKLAGSLGMFGLMIGSQIARGLEDWFQPHIRLTSLQAEQIADQVERLQQELQHKPDVETRSQPAIYTPLILIVDDDLMLAECVRIEAIAWRLRVELATDLEIARRAIAQSSPDVILLDLNFPGAENGFSLLQELMQRVPKIPVLAFTGRDTLSDRLEVVRLGGCVFLQKPLPIHEILKAVTDVLKQNQTRHFNRVLVVDDDAIAITRLAALLQPLAIEVTGLSDPQQFWQVLTTTAPNLLVLDLEMPGFNGVELCQTVRSDPKWQQLPILFLSAHIDTANLDRAFTAGADDYLSKSITDTELATRIIHRLRRVGFETEPSMKEQA